MREAVIRATTSREWDYRDERLLAAIARRVTPRGRVATVLSPAEREVLAMLFSGLSQAEVARLRGTSEQTVRKQTATCRWKMDVQHTWQAMFVAFALGLLDEWLWDETQSGC